MRVVSVRQRHDPYLPSNFASNLTITGSTMEIEAVSSSRVADWWFNIRPSSVSLLRPAFPCNRAEAESGGGGYNRGSLWILAPRPDHWYGNGVRTINRLPPNRPKRLRTSLSQVKNFVRRVRGCRIGFPGFEVKSMHCLVLWCCS